MKRKGYIDRITDGDYAVILVDELQKEYIVPIRDLPQNVRNNVWVNVEINGDKLTVLSIDTEETEKREKEVSEQMERIRKSKKGSRFKRN